MNRIILILALSCYAFTGFAQNPISKVPANASLVIKYSGENFSKNLPLDKMDTYSFIRTNLAKALKMDTLTSLKDLGINVTADTYQYVSTEDSSISFVTLLHLDNLAKFLKLVDANISAEMKPEKKNGYEFLAISPDTYIGWNNDRAVLVVTSYRNTDRYNYYYDDVVATDTTVVSTMPMPDTVMAPVEERKLNAPPPPPAPQRQTTKTKSKKTVPAQKHTATKRPAHPSKKATVKKPVAPKAPEEIIDEEVKPDEETTIVEAPRDFNDSARQAKREAWYREREKKTTARQKLVAGNIIDNSFNGTITSVETDASYKKVIDPGAHVSVWINSANLLKEYWASLFGGYNSFRHYGRDVATAKNEDGFRSGMNVYFDKDKVRIEQRSYSPDEKMANLGKDLFNSKQNTALTNYVNPDNIGYLSMSINSEAMAKYYYTLLKQYLHSEPYISEYSDIVDVYIDLLEIIIDEKGISDLMPGNYMLVLHDMKTKTVTYTDYEYDSDFKYKEIKKTKQELSPNFTFVMETRKPEFIQKVLNLPLKYAEKGKFNYKDKGGYYELVFDTGKYPLTNMYFMLKDGKIIVTTSKASIDMTLNNTGYTLDAETKNSILNNNYSLKVNSKRLIDQLAPELTNSSNKKIANWLEDNIGDLKMESSLKNGMMQGTTTMTIKGNHSNSLEFFFNMINAINDIMEQDKQDREQKLN